MGGDSLYLVVRPFFPIVVLKDAEIVTRALQQRVRVSVDRFVPLKRRHT